MHEDHVVEGGATYRYRGKRTRNGGQLPPLKFWKIVI